MASCSFCLSTLLLHLSHSQKNMHTFGEVGQMRYLTVSASSASALLSTNLPSVLLSAVPATPSYPTPGPLMSTPLVKTGQPSIYHTSYGMSYHMVILVKV